MVLPYLGIASAHSFRLVHIARMPSDNSKRKVNFSNEECIFLTTCYENYKDILDAAHRDANTNSKKNEAWEKIVSLHRNRFPHVARSREDLRVKLSKLKSSAKEIHTAQKKSQKQTGGGKPLPPPNDAQQKMLDLCADTPAFDGLQGADSEEVHIESK